MRVPPEIERRILAAAGLADGPKRTPRPPRLVAPALAVEVTLPHVVKSEANRDGRNWRATNRRRKEAQRLWWEATCLLSPNLHLWASGTTYRVTLTRLGGRRMDPDNLAISFKHVLDAVCAWLGVDDGDEAVVTVAWLQQPGPGPQGVLVRIEGKS